MLKVTICFLPFLLAKNGSQILFTLQCALKFSLRRQYVAFAAIVLPVLTSRKCAPLITHKRLSHRPLPPSYRFRNNRRGQLSSYPRSSHLHYLRITFSGGTQNRRADSRVQRENGGKTLVPLIGPFSARRGRGAQGHPRKHRRGESQGLEREQEEAGRGRGKE